MMFRYFVQKPPAFLPSFCIFMVFFHKAKQQIPSKRMVSAAVVLIKFSDPSTFDRTDGNTFNEVFLYERINQDDRAGCYDCHGQFQGVGRHIL